MRWFTHNSNLRNTPEFKRLTKNLSLPGYGAACMVWEILSQYGKPPDFRLSLKGPFDFAFWQDELNVPSLKVVMVLFTSLAGAGVIDQDLFNQRIIAAPLLQDEVDDWNRRLLAKKAKQAT